jgi:hypothetical protein
MSDSLADLLIDLADPELNVQYQSNPETFLDRYNLSPWEREAVIKRNMNQLYYFSSNNPAGRASGSEEEMPLAPTITPQVPVTVPTVTPTNNQQLPTVEITENDPGGRNVLYVDQQGTYFALRVDDDADQRGP